MGRRMGSSHVRCPSSTRARYRPTGRVTSSRTIEKEMNCNQPLTDMSKLLRVKQGDGEIDEQQDGAKKRECGDKVHGLPQLLTGPDVEKGHGEEDDGVEQHCDVLHDANLHSERWSCSTRTFRMIPTPILSARAFGRGKGSVREA